MQQWDTATLSLGIWVTLICVRFHTPEGPIRRCRGTYRPGIRHLSSVIRGTYGICHSLPAGRKPCICP